MTNKRGTERRRRASDAFQDLFQILMSVNLAALKTGEPNSMVKALLDAAVRLFEVKGSSLGLMDEERGGLRFRVHEGETGLYEFFVPQGKGFAGWVAKTGKPLLSNHPAADPRFYGDIDKRTGIKTRSLMCAPLRDGSQVMGVVQVINTKKTSGFSEKDLRLLTSFGELAGVALNSNIALSEAGQVGSIYRETAEQRYTMVGDKSPAMKAVTATARKVAHSASTVLLMVIILLLLPNGLFGRNE